MFTQNIKMFKAFALKHQHQLLDLEHTSGSKQGHVFH